MPPIALEDVVEEWDTYAGLTESQRSQAAAQVLRSLRHGTNRAFLRTARVAPDVSTPLLETTLTWCATSCDPSVARRARYVLNLLRRDALE